MVADGRFPSGKRIVAVLALPCLLPLGALAPQAGSVGSSAVAFTLEGPDGGSTRFPKRFDPDVELTVLVFWATWNRPSSVELERLADLWPKWSRHGVDVVAVNVESTHLGPLERGRLEDWLEARPLPFPVVIDRGLEAFSAYGVIALPTTIVVDAEGAIVFRLPGYPIAGSEQLIELVADRVIEPGRPASVTASVGSPQQARAVRHVRLAGVLASRGFFDLAEYTLRRAIEEDPRLLEARLALADLYEDGSRTEDAERVLLDAAPSFPEDARLYLAAARLKLHLGLLREAEELAEKAIAANPALSSALVLLGRVRLAAGDREGALARLEQAAQTNPLGVEARVELGRLHEALGDLDRAIEWYEQAYRLLDPTWSP